MSVLRALSLLALTLTACGRTMPTSPSLATCNAALAYRAETTYIMGTSRIAAITYRCR